MPRTPTARTMEYCREKGWPCSKAEHFNSHSGTRHDLFGFMDVVVLRRRKIVAIQATTGPHSSARVRKIHGLEDARSWLECGGLIEVWGWCQYKQKVDGRYWRPRVVKIDLEAWLVGHALEVA